MGTRTPMRRSAGEIRRPQGTGSLLVRRDRRGKETWYGKWWVGRRQTMRALGPRREPGEAVGLTRRQAEEQLRRLMGEERGRPVEERLTLEQVAERFLVHKETVGLRRSTVRRLRLQLPRPPDPLLRRPLRRRRHAGRGGGVHPRPAPPRTRRGRRSTTTSASSPPCTGTRSGAATHA